MPIHVIIDGYNFIRQSADLRELDRQALEWGRDALIENLSEYKRIKRHKVTLVFDGSARYYFPESHSSWRGVGIKFSRHGETADSLIKKMACHEKEKAVVVSSDREVVRFAAAQGAATMESGAFEEKLIMAGHMKSGQPGEGKEPGSSAKQGKTTKKRGPSRKLPKSQRRIRKKTGKL